MGVFSNLFQSVQGAVGPQAVIGVDVGASAIKVVELEERENVLTLVTYGEVQLGPYANKPIGSVVHLTPKQEQEALVDVIRESAVRSRDAVFAVPLSASFISTTTVAADDSADLNAMVRVEARKLIPASLSEVTLDWAELDPVVKEQTGRSVLIAAIQNSAVERFNILMQFAGFGESATEIECFSTARAVPPQTSSVMIDFGAETAKMYILHDGILSRMHRTTASGAHVTDRLAKELECTFAEAEEQKVNITAQSEQYESVQSLYSREYGRSLREFRQVFDAYKNETGATFDHIKICGGASLFPGLPKMVGQTFMLDVEPIDPFVSVAYPAFMEDMMHSIGPVFVPSLGAALRRFE